MIEVFNTFENYLSKVSLNVDSIFFIKECQIRNY